ncbi:MAG: type III toxin-antitoxin system ToxN/AbiQ family toxin [Clostridia bacterium]|nr:type III toxin-antitoxin system ToxN/AbiQ family toxin [Clostridia bacterium]
MRLFIGILFEINNFEYFSLLYSPKRKHQDMKNVVDFFRIKNDKLKVINFNNMISVLSNNYSLVNLTKKILILAKLKYQALIRG